jgi:hypothetical protein
VEEPVSCTPADSAADWFVTIVLITCMVFVRAVGEDDFHYKIKTKKLIKFKYFEKIKIIK